MSSTTYFFPPYTATTSTSTTALTYTYQTLGTAGGLDTIYPGGFNTTQPYIIYPQNEYNDRLAQLTSLENKQRELAYLERQIDAKLEELRSLDREGLLKEMLIITEQQLDSLRSAPRYEAPKEVIVDKRQMELPLELIEELAF